MRRRHVIRFLGSRRGKFLAAGVVALVVAGGALAYFTSTGHGSGTATVGTINPPTSVVATASNNSTTTGPAPVTITWSAPSTGATPSGYRVVRDDGTIQTTLGCSASPCHDTTVTNGVYTYHVRSLLSTSWTSAAADSNPITVQNQQTTSTSLTSSDNPSVVGEKITYTATVSTGSGTPTGTVTFKEGGSAISCESGSSAFNGTTAICKVTYAAPTNGTPHPITAVYSGETSYFGSTSNEVDQAVNRADTTTAVSSNHNPSVTGQSVTYTATISISSPGAGTVSGTVNFKDGGTTITGCGTQTVSSTQATCTISGGYAASGGNRTITAVYSGDTNFNGSTSPNFTQTVNKADQTISFGALANRRLDQSPFTVSATASSGLTVAFTSATTATCTVSGTTVTLLHAGTCTINADQAGNTDWNAAPQVQQSFTINKGNQTITFPALSDVRLDQTAPTPNATASSGLAVSYSTSSTACSVTSGGSITLLHAGTCTIKADQAGNTDWNAASQVPQSFTINKGNQTISFGSAPAFARTGVSGSSVSATATSGLAVTYGSNTTGVCTVNSSSGALTLVAIGLCTITADQAGNTDWNAAAQATQSFQVYNGATAGLAFSTVKVGTNTVTPNCTGTIGTTYTCSVTGQSNNSTISANVIFANASASATIFSAVSQTINWTSTGKVPGSGTVTITGGSSTSSTTVSAQMNGNNGAQVTVTYTTPSGGTWTAVLQIS
jgi:hypothetical protein